MSSARAFATRSRPPALRPPLSNWVQLETSCKRVMGGRGDRTERVWLNYVLPEEGTSMDSLLTGTTPLTVVDLFAAREG